MLNFLNCCSKTDIYFAESFPLKLMSKQPVQKKSVFNVKGSQSKLGLFDM